MQKTRRHFLHKRNLLFTQTMKSAKCPVAACFLHTFLLENKAQTSGKEIGDHVQKFSSFGQKQNKNRPNLT